MICTFVLKVIRNRLLTISKYLRNECPWFAQIERVEATDLLVIITNQNYDNIKILKPGLDCNRLRILTLCGQFLIKMTNDMRHQITIAE